MSWYLYRMARWCYRRSVAVIAVWVVALVALGVASSAWSGSTSGSLTLPGLESTEAQALIKQRTPQANPDGAAANVVFQAPVGRTLLDSKREVDAVLARVKTEHVASVASPFDVGTISQDGRTGYAAVGYSVGDGDLTDDERALLESLHEDPAKGGLTVAVGGSALGGAAEPSATELLGVAVALVVLVLTLGTLLAAGMSILNAFIGVGFGFLAIQLGTGFMDLSSTTPALASMLGLAVGIDYSLFIVSRFRQELAHGREPEEAAGRSVGTAGTAVLFAGVTVIIALAGFSVVDIRFLTEMGLAAALTVTVAVLIALTLLPAMFRFTGRKLLRSRLPFIRVNEEHMDGEGTTNGARWVQLLLRRKWLVFVSGIAAAVVISIPVASMQLAIPDQGTSPEGSQPRIAYDLIAENFGAGANGPLVVVIDTAKAADANVAIEKINAAVRGVDRDVAAVVPAGPAVATPEAVAAFQQQIDAVNFAAVTIIPQSGPSAEATKNLVDDVRDVVRSAASGTGADVYVTGQTAVGIDISSKLGEVFPLYMVVVVGLAFVLLLAVFRSIWIPVKAVVGFLVSVGVALGATVAVAQWGWGAELIGIDTEGPILSFLPLLLTGILFGLAMDYELFLVSRMREEHAHGADANTAISKGFAHGARVVTAAAVIMVSVFAGFAMVDDPILKMIGFGLAVGVLADAFLVRMTLVPAVMAIAGERIWWMPKWLDRALPNFDIEGEKLSERLDR